MWVEQRMRELGLHGMADEWAEITKHRGCSCGADRALVQQLVDAENQYRHEVWVGTALDESHLPMGYTLDRFDLAQLEASSKVRQLLYTTEFTRDSRNLVLVGASGMGKTHLVAGIGLNAIYTHCKQVRYFSANDLAERLARESGEGQAGTILTALSLVDIVIVDGLGCAPLDAHVMALLFQLLNALDGHASLIVTTSIDRKSVV